VKRWTPHGNSGTAARLESPPLRRFSTATRPANNEGAKVQVLVRDNNVDQALKALKKKMQREGILR
jgi:hypothetical protein